MRVLVKTAVVAALSWPVPLVGGKAGQTEKAVETIVFIRHGEKPEGGFGQLNCQGLNRALALAPIIAKYFGRPDAIFAPNPSHLKEDAGRLYDYVRPLATIEPTAIWFGLPVDVSLDFQDKEGLQAALENAARARPQRICFCRMGAQANRAHSPGALSRPRGRGGDGEKGPGLGSQRLRQHVRRYDQRNKSDLRSKA